ncbi:translocator protein-like protein [Entophlyctis helioformis]|nr:translocator protein-like protein [Entophlyctis helioformis]
MSVLDLFNVPLIVAVGVPLVGGINSGKATASAIKGWYKTIKKPSWNPPNWVFGPAWTYLYITMGYASYRVYSSGADEQAVKTALSLYGVQLILNFVWPPLFFNYKLLGIASAEILTMLGTIVATGVSFYNIDHLAGYLLAPYAAWISFASLLNIWIWLNNPSKPSAPKKDAK